MKIEFVEIQNFRKLKSTHIDFDDETTLFVGANNSGKTSAMLALRYFLVSPRKLSLRDITVANWTKLDEIGTTWEQGGDVSDTFESLLPTLDVWLDVPLSEIHHVVHILPTIDWSGGLLGVRLRYESDALEKLRDDFLRERTAAKEATASGTNKTARKAPKVWPMSLTDFLERRLQRYLDIEAYALDPAQYTSPHKGAARPQALPDDAVPLDKDPFKPLLRIDEIAAQRDFADAGDRRGGMGGDDQADSGAWRYKRKLADQLRSYYDRHLDPTKSPAAEDYEALAAIQLAETNFDTRLKVGFAAAFEELEDLGYPGVSNPKLKINTQLRATDGLRHGSAIAYEVADPAGDGSQSLQLPEDYSGLGYQNLISMVFMLMSFRDGWMRVGKSASAVTAPGDDVIRRLHVVLVEEPEAHLHAQVQQVFIKKAYALLRNHEDLGEHTTFATQLIVSTHSSHVAHEADFSSLRYFRRRRAASPGEPPTTTVANLSQVFGTGDDTQRFVKRYLKATHCDLFFADAVIFVEGQAERILVPHFIQHHFERLSRRYVTLLDLGGSHAHRFRSIVTELGLTILIIADLDATRPVVVTTKTNVPTTRWRSTRPELEQGQRTANPVLKQWHPSKENIDDLLALTPDDHVARIDDDCDLYVAFQKRISVPNVDNGSEEVIPRTFEDALVLANKETLGSISGSATTQKIRRIVETAPSDEDLAEALFELLKDADKAAFALDCLMIEEPTQLVPPPYINDGLSWLDEALEEQTVGAPRQATVA